MPLASNQSSHYFPLLEIVCTFGGGGVKIFPLYTNFAGFFANWYLGPLSLPKQKGPSALSWMSPPRSESVCGVCWLGLFSSLLLQVCILYLDEMLPTSPEPSCEFMWFFLLFPHILSPLMSWTQWTAVATVSLSNPPEGMMRFSSLYRLATRSLLRPPRSPAIAPPLESVRPRRTPLSWMELLQSVSW